MSNFVPENYDLRTALIFCYHLKKIAAESHRMLVEAYSVSMLLVNHSALSGLKNSKVTILRNEERGKPPKKFEDSELQTLLDENDAQTQQLADQLNVTRETVSIRLKSMGKIQKMGKWVPHELNEKQQENRKTTCKILLARYKRKSFLHRIVTGEKWIYFENPKRKRSWVTPGETLTSTARLNRYRRQCSMFGGIRKV